MSWLFASAALFLIPFFWIILVPKILRSNWYDTLNADTQVRLEAVSFVLSVAGFIFALGCLLLVAGTNGRGIVGG